MKHLITLILLFLLTTKTSKAQWTKIVAVPEVDIMGIAQSGNTLVAAAFSNSIYISNDGGNTWLTRKVGGNSIRVTSAIFFDNKLFLGTNSLGAFSTVDNGLTWLNTGTELYHVSQFEIMNHKLYAATMGTGVSVYDSNTLSWIPMNDSLPNYSNSVNTLVNSGSSLLIAAGANGTFYRYNFNNNYWKEEYYTGSYAPGLMIHKFIYESPTLFASNGNRLMRSDNDGLTWQNDNVGLHNGLDRKIFKGISNYYVATNNLGNNIWLQYRAKSDAALSTWSKNDELISNLYAYDFLEYGEKLFLATHKGLYTKTLVSSIKNHYTEIPSVKIYPNPSQNKTLYLNSSETIKSIEILNLQGEVIYQTDVHLYQTQIVANCAKGLYILKADFENGSSSLNKVIID